MSTSATSYTIIPVKPYPAPPPYPTSSVLLSIQGVSKIKQGSTGIVFTIQNLTNTETNLILHYFSRGITKIYDFVNNLDGTGTFKVDFDDNYIAYSLIVYTVNSTGTAVNSGYKYVLGYANKELIGSEFIIYPKFLPHSYVYNNLLNNVTNSLFINKNQNYTIPYKSKKPTTFILEVKEVGKKITITRKSNNNENVLKKVIIPSNPISEISLYIPDGISEIIIKDDNDNEYRVTIGCTYFATYLESYALDFYANLHRNLDNKYNAIFKIFSSKLGFPFLKEKYYNSLPNNKVENTVALRLLLKSLTSNASTTNTVNDAVRGLTLNNPVIVENSTDIEPINPMLNPIYSDQELEGGFDFHIWNDNYCSYSWALFKKLIINVGYKVVKATDNEIIFYDDNDILKRHVYPPRNSSCLISEVGADCHKDVNLDIFFDSYSLVLFSTGYPLDNVVINNERKSNTIINEDLYYEYYIVGEIGNNVKIQYTFSAVTGISITNFYTIDLTFPSGTNASAVQHIVESSSASNFLNVSLINNNSQWEDTSGYIYLENGFDKRSNLNKFKETYAIINTNKKDPLTALNGDLFIKTEISEQVFYKNENFISNNTGTYDLAGKSLIVYAYNEQGTATTGTVIFPSGASGTGMSTTSVINLITNNITSVFYQINTDFSGNVSLYTTENYLEIDTDNSDALTGVNSLGYFSLYDKITFNGETTTLSAVNSINEQGTYIQGNRFTDLKFQSENPETYANPFSTSGINGIIDKTLNIDIYDNVDKSIETESFYFNPVDYTAGTYTVYDTATGVAYRINTSSSNIEATATSISGDSFLVFYINDVNANKHIYNIHGDALDILGNFSAIENKYITIQSKKQGHVFDDTEIEVNNKSTSAVLTNIGLVTGTNNTTYTYPTYPKTTGKNAYSFIIEDNNYEGMPYLSRFDSGLGLDSLRAKEVMVPIITSQLTEPFYGLPEKYFSFSLYDNETGISTDIDIEFDATSIGYAFTYDPASAKQVADYLNLRLKDTNNDKYLKVYYDSGLLRFRSVFSLTSGSEIIILEREATSGSTVHFLGFNEFYSKVKESYTFTGATDTLTVESFDNLGKTTSVNTVFSSGISYTTDGIVSSLNTSFSGYYIEAYNFNNRVTLRSTDKDWNINITGNAIPVFDGSTGNGFIKGKIVKIDKYNDNIYQYGPEGIVSSRINNNLNIIEKQIWDVETTT